MTRAGDAGTSGPGPACHSLVMPDPRIAEPVDSGVPGPLDSEVVYEFRFDRKVAGVGTVQRAIRAPAVSVIGATVVLIAIVGALHPPFLHTGQLLDIVQASVY